MEGGREGERKGGRDGGREREKERERGGGRVSITDRKASRDVEKQDKHQIGR